MTAKTVSRFEEILKRIPPCNVLLDVGCDHGIISDEALKRGIAKSVICTDISAPSLEKAKRLIGEKGRYFVADGIPDGVNDFDFAVIAGMGGKEIMKILSAKKIGRGLLQPMKNVDDLRKFLVANGYRICSDEIIKDGKFYNIVVTERGKDALSENETLFGRTNLSAPSEAFLQYLDEEEKKTAAILKKATGKRKEECESYLKKISEIKNENKGNNRNNRKIRPA